MKIVRIELGPFLANSYVLLSQTGDEVIVIDPATASLEIRNLLEDRKLKYILNTHGHFDHISGNNFIKQGTTAKLVIHKDDAPLLNDSTANLSEYFLETIYSPPADIEIDESGFEFDLGEHHFVTIHVPGHSAGSVAYYCAQNKALFSGDLIFASSVGRTDLPNSDSSLLKKSIAKLLELPDDTKVYPGHEERFTIGEFREQYKKIEELID